MMDNIKNQNLSWSELPAQKRHLYFYILLVLVALVAHSYLRS
jgi:hypothetical protein